MSCKKLSFFYIFLIVLSSTFVTSVGIGQYSRERQILFQPGLEKTYSFQLSDSLKIDASIEGDLAQYAVINDPLPGGPVRNIEVTLKLPDYLDPGVHILYVVASEKAEVTANVGGVSSVRVGLEVFALYPGKHPKVLGVIVNDVNINESTTLGLSVVNHGEETIENAYGNISVYGPDGTLITVLGTDTRSIAPYESVAPKTTFDTSQFNLAPGTYKAVGNFTYDNINYNEVLEGYFIIGQMKINIIDSTKELFVNSTNKFIMALESDWNGDIDNVYARITLPNGKIVKTPNVDLIKNNQGLKASALVETYVETDGLSVGTHMFDVMLYYKGLSSTNKVSVNIIDGKPPEVEKPNLITPMTIFIAVSVIIVLFVILYFFVFRKDGGRNNNNSSHTNNSSNAQSSNDIRPPSL